MSCPTLPTTCMDGVHNVGPRHIGNLEDAANQAIRAWKAGNRGQALSMMRQIIVYDVQGGSSDSVVADLVGHLIELGDPGVIPILNEIACKYEYQCSGLQARSGIKIMCDPKALTRYRAYRGVSPYTAVRDMMELWKKGRRADALELMKMHVEHSGGASISELTRSIKKAKDPGLVPILKHITKYHGSYWAGEDANKVLIEFTQTPTP